MPTEFPLFPATPAQLVIMRAAREKFIECEAKCPGIGANLPAMNLRFLIQGRQFTPRLATEGAPSLVRLAASLGIDAADEAAALASLADPDPHGLLAAAKHLLDRWDKGNLSEAAQRLAAAVEDAEA